MTKLSPAAKRFMDHKPTELGRIGSQVFYEHPTRGDTAPIYTIGKHGDLINTGFFDLGDEENLMDEVAEQERQTGEDLKTAEFAAERRAWFHHELRTAVLESNAFEIEYNASRLTYWVGIEADARRAMMQGE